MMECDVFCDESKKDHKLHKKKWVHFDPFGQEQMWPCWECVIMAEQNFSVLHCGEEEMGKW